MNGKSGETETVLQHMQVETPLRVETQFDLKSEEYTKHHEPWSAFQHSTKNIFHVPADHLYLVCNFLSLRSLMQLGLTCTYMRDVANNPASLYQLGYELFDGGAWWLVNLLSLNIKHKHKHKNGTFLNRFKYVKKVMINPDRLSTSEQKQSLYQLFGTFRKIESLMIHTEYQPISVLLSNMNDYFIQSYILTVVLFLFLSLSEMIAQKRD